MIKKNIKNAYHILIKYFILINNILLMIINLYFILYNENNIDYKIDIKMNNFRKITSLEFKNSDNYILNLINNNYYKISNYLNNKYNYRNNNYIKNKIFFLIKLFFHNNKKKISLYSVDLFSFDFHKKWLKKLLKNKYIIQFDNNNPDYLIFNTFGTEYLNPKYNKSIKIAIFTENKIPDFYEADYAIGHYHINYLDRYFKYSIFLWKNLNNNYFDFIRKKVINNKRINFCASLISNNFSTDGFRLYFINELSKYKKVDMGGKYNNNIGKNVYNKIEFLSSYKFSIAMENSQGDGYISEKLVDSFLAGNIPIYYGDYMFDEYINPKSIILIKGEKDMQEKIDYIKKIDNDENLYKSILNEKVLLDNNIKNKTETELREFLYHIFDQDKLKGFRKNN